MSGKGEHWGEVYERSATTEVSWFEPDPGRSLELIGAAGLVPSDAIVDVGGGASLLVDRLLDRGYHDVTVVDVAGAALAASRTRLGSRAADVEWIPADLLTWRPPRRYRLWHDRAVFHFLTGQSERDRYRQTLHTALAPGGHVAIGTFAANGPTHCSGLPVARYTADDLAAEFPGLRPVRTVLDVHHTPAGGAQPFTWLLLAGSED